MTYSIIGRDPDSGEIGAAVQSKFPGVGSIALHGRAGVGCVTTQAFANPLHGENGLALLALRASPEEALPVLLRADPERGQRQVALMDFEAAPAAFTGDEVLGWEGSAGSRHADHCVASGNALASDAVLDAMVEAFGATAGELTARLIAALRAGRDAGGELRGQQSAAVLVVKSDGGYGGAGGRHVDISVYDHAQPIEELARCFELHRLSYFPSDPADLVPVDAGIARELKAILAAKGYTGLGEGGGWGEAEIAALKRFMGMENYDNRLRDDALIDAEVLADIRRKHAG